VIELIGWEIEATGGILNAVGRVLSEAVEIDGKVGMSVASFFVHLPIWKNSPVCTWTLGHRKTSTLGVGHSFRGR